MGRELGDPERFFVNDASELPDFVKRCAAIKRPCFCSVQPFHKRNSVFGLEKLFFDFDSKADPPDKGEAFNEALSFVERLKNEHGIELFIVETYRGFHLYAFLWKIVEAVSEKEEVLKGIYERLQTMLLDQRDYKTLDRTVIGDIKRLARVPYSAHELGIICTPIDLDRRPLQPSQINLSFYREHGLNELLFKEAVKSVRLKKIAEKIFAEAAAFRPKTTSVKRKGYAWIEQLLTRPVDDGRHRLIWLVIAPYLVNVKGLDLASAKEAALNYLLSCSELKAVDGARRLADYYVEYAARRGLKPIALRTLKEKYLDLYEIVDEALR